MSTQWIAENDIAFLPIFERAHIEERDILGTCGLSPPFPSPFQSRREEGRDGDAPL